MGIQTETRRIDALSKSLQKMKKTTATACLRCDQLTQRARQLDSLTSPASDASSMLSKASKNLGATLVLMKDAREKFDTIVDCEPAIDRMHRGVVHMQNEKSGKTGGKKGAAVAARHNPFGDKNSEKEKNVILTEQDVYSAADSMEIIRDAYEYFIDRRHWRSTANSLSSLERVHEMGVSSMCILESFHLIDSGQAVRIKRVVKQEGESQVTPANETAQQVRTTSVFARHFVHFHVSHSVVLLSQHSLFWRCFRRPAIDWRRRCRIGTCCEVLGSSRNTSPLKRDWSESYVGSLNASEAMAFSWAHRTGTNHRVWPTTLVIPPTALCGPKRLGAECIQTWFSAP